MGGFKVSYAMTTKEDIIPFEDEQELFVGTASSLLQQQLAELEDRMRTAAAIHWLSQKVGKEHAENWQVLVLHPDAE